MSWCTTFLDTLYVWLSGCVSVCTVCHCLYPVGCLVWSLLAVMTNSWLLYLFYLFCNTSTIWDYILRIIVFITAYVSCLLCTQGHSWWWVSMVTTCLEEMCHVAMELLTCPSLPAGWSLYQHFDYDQGGHRSWKVLEQRFPFFQAWKVLENWIWPWKFLDFDESGSWKSLNSGSS